MYLGGTGFSVLPNPDDLQVGLTLTSGGNFAIFPTVTLELLYQTPTLI